VTRSVVKYVIAPGLRNLRPNFTSTSLAMQLQPRDDHPQQGCPTDGSMVTYESSKSCPTGGIVVPSSEEGSSELVPRVEIFVDDCPVLMNRQRTRQGKLSIIMDHRYPRDPDMWSPGDAIELRAYTGVRCHTSPVLCWDCLRGYLLLINLIVTASTIQQAVIDSYRGILLLNLASPLWECCAEPSAWTSKLRHFISKILSSNGQTASGLLCSRPSLNILSICLSLQPHEASIATRPTSTRRTYQPLWEHTAAQMKVRLWGCCTSD
jgi:hypothetical protein